MNLTFKAFAKPEWSVHDTYIVVDGKKYDLNAFVSAEIFANNYPSAYITLHTKSEKIVVYYSHKQDKEANEAFTYIRDNLGDETIKAERKKLLDGIVFRYEGAYDKEIFVYEDRVMLKTHKRQTSFMIGSFNDGDKTIYYKDCTGVQFKEADKLYLGYLQLETSSTQIANNDKYHGENSFAFLLNFGNEKAREVYNFINNKIAACKTQNNQQVIINQSTSVADEILKFKQLLDMGVISNEEFETKKKELLGL